MRRVLVLGLLLTSCNPLPLPVPGPLSQQEMPADTVRVLLCGVQVPGMYAAHNDSIDTRTYQGATATPAKGLTVYFRIRRSTPGRYVIYRTGQD